MAVSDIITLVVVIGIWATGFACILWALYRSPHRS